MKPLRDLPLAQRQLLFVAAVVAVALLSMYVQLLHDSLARGEELREVQRISGLKKTSTAAPPARDTLVRPSQIADRSGALAR